MKKNQMEVKKRVELATLRYSHKSVTVISLSRLVPLTAFCLKIIIISIHLIFSCFCKSDEIASTDTETG